MIAWPVERALHLGHGDQSATEREASAWPARRGPARSDAVLVVPLSSRGRLAPWTGRL